MISYSATKPVVLEKGIDGRCLYHWDIVEETVENDDGGTYVQYHYQEVAVYAPLSANKILRAVITERWDEDEEQKLINEYNAVALGISMNDKAIENYKAFLTERAALKAQVEKDCEALGIK